MDTPQPTREVCSVCHQETRGGFQAFEDVMYDGTPIIGFCATPDRDFNVCDLCNAVAHFRCSKHPETGYCDACFDTVYPDGQPSAVGTSAISG